jgi:hypothetical protein
MLNVTSILTMCECLRNIAPIVLPAYWLIAGPSPELQCVCGQSISNAEPCVWSLIAQWSRHLVENETSPVCVRWTYYLFKLNSSIEMNGLKMAVMRVLNIDPTSRWQHLSVCL